MVTGLSTNSLYNIGIGEISRVCRRWIGIIRRLANVIDVPVARTTDRSLDLIVADTICILAVGVAPRFCALLDSRETLVVVGTEEAGTLRVVDELLVRVVVTELDICLFLDR